MKHFASPEFWKAYHTLPEAIRALADKNFELLKRDSTHPSLHFKKANQYHSVRVGLYFRALGIAVEDGVLWFWIGSHAEYDKILR